MSEAFRDLDELRGLIDSLCEEAITPEQVRRLEELVLAHPEAEAYYVQAMGLYADLARHFRGQPAKPTPVPRRRPRWPPALAAAGLAGSVLLAIGLWPWPTGTPTLRPPVAAATPEPTDATVAVLLSAPGAVWEDTGLPTRPGSPLLPGRLRLTAGVACVEFYSGATVVLEGPAELELISPDRAYCARGRLRATVPPQAQGFTVGTPTLDLVDRGTEFGLSVGGDAATEVHVFVGQVDVYDLKADRAAAPKRELTTGQGMRLDGTGAADIRPDPAAFRTTRDVAARSADETRRRHRDWLAASEDLRRDPDMVVYYPFDAAGPWDRTLADRTAGRDRPRDGAIVGGTWGPGRWPGKWALEFRQVSDRVRFHVPGEYRSLTLAAWVRVDALPHLFTSVMHTDRFDLGNMHWHINRDGRVGLGVPNRPYREYPNGRYMGSDDYSTPPVFPPERLGRWTHLAVAYDGDAKEVVHYVDGREAARHAIAFDVPLRVGDVEIGNLNRDPRKGPAAVRFLNGAMDEFAIFSRALGADELTRLYESGRPPS